MKLSTYVFSAFAACAFALAACASDKANEPAFTVVEQNASIANRSFIRRISVLDDDMLLIEATANEYYQVKLFPGCVSFADAMTPAHIEETGIGVDRGTRFVINGRNCPVRSIDRVVRTPPAAHAAEQPAAETAPTPQGS